MSQIYKRLTSSGPIPGNIPTEFETDDGTAIPALNILNVNGENGITTRANPDGSNNLLISIQNGAIGQAQTIGAETEIIITTTPLVDGTYTFEARVSGYDILGLGACGFSRNAVFRRTGGLVTLIGDADGFSHKTTAVGENLSNTDVNYATDGTVMTLQVTGEAGFTINWGAFSAYVFRGIL